MAFMITCTMKPARLTSFSLCISSTLELFQFFLFFSHVLMSLKQLRIRVMPLMQ